MFIRELDVELFFVVQLWVCDVEQSNISVIFDWWVIFKVFCWVSSGINFDIELNCVFICVGNLYVVCLLGVYQFGWFNCLLIDVLVYVLGMVIEYEVNVVEGWVMVIVSVWDFFVEGDFYVYEVGGDFVGEFYWFGEVVVLVYVMLVDSFGIVQVMFLVDWMLVWLLLMVVVVFELWEYVLMIEQ